ncbi:MAG: oligosaccharide repeat unit polymerase [Acidobacteria bacterium]|nr:oligosaccharide repeat unit polymerase [Acidobacteriota bacterium]
MQSLTWNCPPLVIATAPRLTMRTTLLAILSTSMATALAIVLVPDASTEPGALFYPALVMAIGLALAPFTAAVRHPKTLLRGESLLTLAPIYWLLLDLLQGVYSLDHITADQIRQAFLAIGLFVVMVWVGSVRRPWTTPDVLIRSVSQEFSLNTYFALALACFFLGMLNFAVPCNFNVFEMAYYVGQERWAAPWGRGQLGGWDAFLDHLQYFGYLLPILTVVIGRRVGLRNARTLICIALSIVMTLFLAQSGSRRVIGVVAGMALVLWILDQRQLRVKHLIATMLSVFVLLLALQVMLEYRNVGLGVLVGKGDATVSRMEKRQVFEEQHLRVDDNFYRLCQIIQLIPQSYGFVYHKYLVYVLVRPVPRVFWPEKPVDPGFDLPAALGVEGVSYSYSVIGELYMSLGFIGIALGGWFYGRVASFARGLLSRSATQGALVTYSIIVMALFSGMRSILELILVSYVVLAWVGISQLFIKLRRTA